MKKISATKINWKKNNGLIPAIVQDSANGLVLMLGYMNEEAFKKTIQTSFIWFYSRTRKKLWMKGEESKNTLRVADIKLDCDSDTILIKAIPSGPTCHTGDITCFKETPKRNVIEDLAKRILDRKNKLPKNSYTTSLFKSGLDRMSLKVAEESLEVIHAAQKETKKRLIEETTDLLYHLLVLLAEKNVSLEEVETEIKKRNK